MTAAREARDAHLVREFVDDALALLAEFDLGLLKLEAGSPQPAVVNNLFRVIHSIKGNAGFFGGFQTVRRVAHAMEDVLDRPRRTARGCQPLEHALLSQGSALLGQALRAQLAGGASEDGRGAGADDDSYCARVGELRAQPAGAAAAVGEPGEPALPGAAPFGPEATIKVEAAALAAFAREVLAVHAGLAELTQASPSAVVLQRRMAGLVEALAELRTVPLHQLFDRLPAMVGTLAQTLGKSVAVQAEGGDLRVDRALLKVLEGALVHLIRNALDHGIERQDVRARRGKPAVGRLSVKATQARGRLHLQVEDDGGGIDPKRMRLEAVMRKVMTEPEAVALSDEAAVDLVFRPGFSTASDASEVSGRGVGMDAVRSGLRQNGGDVRVRSTPRQGTLVVLELPAEPVSS